MLNLPMDYRNDDFLREMVSKFGKLRSWLWDDPSPLRTLLKVAYRGARDIPRSIVVRETQRFGGTVVSWTVPMFILNSENADVLPGDDSPDPKGGNPHPFFGPPVVPVPLENDWVMPPAQPEPAWEAWADGNAGHVGDNMDVEMDQAQPEQEVVQQQASVSVSFFGTTVESKDVTRAQGPMQYIEIQQQVENNHLPIVPFVPPHQHLVQEEHVVHPVLLPEPILELVAGIGEGKKFFNFLGPQKSVSTPAFGRCRTHSRASAPQAQPRREISRT